MHPMRRTIWKFLVKDGVVRMPRSGQILSVQRQGEEEINCWALVDPNEPAEDRHLRIYGTGHPVPDEPGTYLATVQDGSFVWHVFEHAA